MGQMQVAAQPCTPNQSQPDTHHAIKTGSDSIWDAYRAIRNRVNGAIYKSKKQFKMVLKTVAKILVKFGSTLRYVVPCKTKSTQIDL